MWAQKTLLVTLTGVNLALHEYEKKHVKTIFTNECQCLSVTLYIKIE
jgi:hypothetical protein